MFDFLSSKRAIRLTFIFILGALFVYFFPWATHVRVTGIVIDETTNKPVPNARLIVTLYRRGFPNDPMIAKYGLVTDGEGRFTLDRRAPRRFHAFWVEASAPTNLYGTVHLSGRSDDVVISVGAPPAAIAQWEGVQYERFTGTAPWLGVEDVEFINESWPVLER